jgi:hypothetical protein
MRPRAAFKSFGSMEVPSVSRMVWVTSIIGSIFNEPGARPSFGSSASKASISAPT